MSDYEVGEAECYGSVLQDIYNAPTIEAVTMDKIEKIRQEIKRKQRHYQKYGAYDVDLGLQETLNIIDKYIKE